MNSHKSNLHEFNVYLNKGLWVVLVKQVLHRWAGAGLSDTLASV